jgi:hypothetical protein
MKELHKFCWTFVITGLILTVGGVLFQNFTGSAVGIAIIGMGTTILASDTGATARTLATMWIILGIIIVVFLGAEGVIPLNVTFGT